MRGMTPIPLSTMVTLEIMILVKVCEGERKRKMSVGVAKKFST